MSRNMLLKLTPLIALALAFVAWERPAPVGPPWLSIEMPANPMFQETRGAALVVHAYHHGNAAGYTIRGTAEGIVDGQRHSIPLQLTRVKSAIGTYALTQQWPSEGNWVLAFGVAESDDVGLVVELGDDGGVTRGEFYDFTISDVTVRSARVVTGNVGAEIDAALNALARGTR